MRLVLFVTVTCLGWFCSHALAEPPAAPKPLRPLSEADRQLFVSSKEDPPAAELGGTTDLLKGKHYVTSNENAVHRFEPLIRGLGGGYVGVGTDQSYLFIGWQKAELAWLFDYDPVVADVHDIYLAFFAAAPSSEKFLALWSKAEKPEALAMLDAAYAGEQRKRARAAYNAYRPEIARRLQATAKQQRELSVASFLTSPEQYDYVSQLVRAGRVRRMVGDLVAEHGLLGIADVAKRLHVPVRVLYMSNAEEYFRQTGYGDQFRKNAHAVLTDPRALVLRTISTYPENKDYTYASQPGPNFIAWLDRPWLKNVFQITPHVKRTPEEIKADRFPIITLDADPDASAAAKFAASQPAGTEKAAKR